MVFHINFALENQRRVPFSRDASLLSRMTYLIDSITLDKDCIFTVCDIRTLVRFYNYWNPKRIRVNILGKHSSIGKSFFQVEIVF